MKLSQTLYQYSGLVLPAITIILVLTFSGLIDPYLSYVATSWVIFGLLGLSLDIVWGRGGLLSLGQTAFFGLGGYFGSIAAINMSIMTGNTLIWSLPIGALFGCLFALMIGWIIFYARMGPLQSTILSYTFTLLLWAIMQSFKADVGTAVIGGDNGMSNIPGMVLEFGEKAEALDPTDGFIVTAIIAALIYFFTRWLHQSTFGHVIDCVRLDSQKTELLGYDVRKYQLLNFGYAGAVAGIAGALFGAWANYLNPSIFSVQEALLVPIYVLVGGVGTLAGPFVGALTVGGLSFYLGSGVVGGQTTLILGLVLVVLVMFLRSGILGTIDVIWSKTLPDPNDAARDTSKVKIDIEVLESILTDVAQQTETAKRLETQALVKQFGGVIPVDKVSLTFEPGQPFSLIGPNGAGKSSFLKTCVGVYPPDAGQVLIGQQDVTKVPICDRVHLGMGVKNQKPQVFGDLPVMQNLWIAAYSRTQDRSKAREISEKISHMLGLDQQAQAQASALSHGKQQWLDIGMVLCLAPRVLFLDEPAAGMTNEETRELSKLLRILAKRTTVIVIEHDMEFVRTLEGHVTVLHQGEVFAEGNISMLREDDRILDIYLGRHVHV